MYLIVAIIAILSIIAINTIMVKKESKIIITSNATIVSTDSNGEVIFKLTNLSMEICG